MTGAAPDAEPQADLRPRAAHQTSSGEVSFVAFVRVAKRLRVWPVVSGPTTASGTWVLAIVWGIGSSWWFGAIAGGTAGGSQSSPPAAARATERILKWAAVARLALWLIMLAILLGVVGLAAMVPLWPASARSSTTDGSWPLPWPICWEREHG